MSHRPVPAHGVGLDTLETQLNRGGWIGARQCDGDRAPHLRSPAIPRRAHPLYGDCQKVGDLLYLEDQVIATHAEGLGFHHHLNRTSLLASDSLTVVA